MNAEIGTRKLELLRSVLHRLLFGVERVAVIWVGALLVLEQRFSVGMLFAFFAYKEQFALRVSALIDKGVELKMLRLQGERLADIVLTEPEADGALLAPRFDVSAAAIELRNVSFRASDVLRGQPAIEPGERWPSARRLRQTTLLKRLASTPHLGRGALPLARVGLRAWRDRVGAVMQDEPLFAGTVTDNISFFDPQPDSAWVEQCARVASVHDEIDAMPMGYQSLVGETGTGLSGGQKQRLLLARALYKRPQILMLDEATSALDVERERAVNLAVRQLALTRVIVAHRPETVASAGRVIALHDGRVAQDLRSVTGTMPMQ
jgi:ATP-binding cassette subfamily B protein RaxB